MIKKAVKNRKVKGVLIDLNQNKQGVQEIQDNCATWWDILDCYIFEQPTVYVGGKPFTVVCDEEGLCYNKETSAYDNDLKTSLVGNLFFCHNGDDGYFADLSEEDINHVLDYVRQERRVCITNTSPYFEKSIKRV